MCIGSVFAINMMNMMNPQCGVLYLSYVPKSGYSWWLLICTLLQDPIGISLQDLVGTSLQSVFLRKELSGRILLCWTKLLSPSMFYTQHHAADCALNLLFSLSSQQHCECTKKVSIQSSRSWCARDNRCLVADRAFLNFECLHLSITTPPSDKCWLYSRSSATTELQQRFVNEGRTLSACICVERVTRKVPSIIDL